MSMNVCLFFNESASYLYMSMHNIDLFYNLRIQFLDTAYYILKNLGYGEICIHTRV